MTVRKGVWKEFDAPQVKVDAYRRNLQNAYLGFVNTKLNGVSPAAAGRAAGGGGGRGGRGLAQSEDEKPFYRAETPHPEQLDHRGAPEGHRSRYQGAPRRRQGPDRKDPGS